MFIFKNQEFEKGKSLRTMSICSFPATLLYTAAATDADASQTLTYAFTASSTVMTIDPNNGKVSLLSALDYETATSHTVRITATDSGAMRPTIALSLQKSKEFFLDNTSSS